MGPEIKRLRLATLIVSLIEIVALGLLLLLYFLEFPSGIQAALGGEFWSILASSLVLFNIIYAWILVRLAGSMRQNSDLKAAELIGGDVQEAYKFGEIGMIVTDENDIVIWSNNVFQSKVDILDKNILDWKDALKDLKEGSPDTVVSIDIDNFHYDVKYLSEAHLFLFKNVTELVNMTRYKNQTSLVLGLIVIDNYSEIVGSQEDENNDIVTRVRSEIINYCKEHGVVLRRFKNDSYLAICTYEALGGMENDGFDILNRARGLAGPADVKPTLSIGFAHDFPDPEQINDMASQAVDFAMSRGGDQAVVSEYDKEKKIYGGKTEAVESQSKVKIRNFADGFISVIKESKNVYVMGHADADMDAIGACLGVLAICEYCKVPCKVVYDQKNTEKKARIAFQRAFGGRVGLEKITISPKEASAQIKVSTLLVVVDVSVPERTHAPELLDKSNKTVVIDHHRMGASFIEPSVLSYIEPSASSASEILAECIRYATANPRIEIKSTYATLMLAGMFLDTNFFKSKTVGIATFDAAEVLKTYGADNSLADDYLKDEFEEYSLTNKIISTMKTPYLGIVCCVADDHDIIDRASISKVANQLMQLKGVNAAFVIGRVGDNEVGISCRSDSTVNVQMLAEKMNGGGHFSAAAASFKDKDVASVDAILQSTLATYLSEARTVVFKEEE